MNLLIITWNYPPRRGGIENLMGSLCGELRKKHAVHVITAHVSDFTTDENGIHRAPWPGLFAFAVYALWRGATLLAWERKTRAVIGGSALVTPLVLILARIFRRRAVVLAHGLDVIHRNFFYQLLCVRGLKFCDRVIANSSYTAALVESKDVVRKRLTVIPPGVHPEHFNIRTDIVATKRRWNIEGKKVILFVGRLAKRKGVKDFIERSFVQILREIPQACFVIVGDNPSESLAHREDVITEIKAAVARNRLESHVRLLGPQSDDQVIQLYQTCDLVVLPALDIKGDVEGFGIVAIEAAAAGKPVVATRVGGIPDAVDDGRSGILVDPDRYEELSRCINGLLLDDEKRLVTGEYARDRVKAHFSWATVITRYEAAMES